MIARVWSIVAKEFIQIRRDPRTLAIVLVMPLMQLVLFGYAINTAVDHIAKLFDQCVDLAAGQVPLGVVDEPGVQAQLAQQRQ